MTGIGKLAGIAIKRKKKALMESFESVEVTPSKGISGDFRGKPGDRQVTVLSKQSWEEACKEIGKSLDWTERRANLLVDNIQLEQTTSKRLLIGKVELLITRETDPCERMDNASQGLCNALAKHWRGGVCCRVLKGGQIRIGDMVKMLD